MDAFFSFSPKGEKTFRYGQETPIKAAECARNCPHFSPDDEDECTADEPVSCYNCRWRRWSASAFTCRYPHEAQ